MLTLLLLIIDAKITKKLQKGAGLSRFSLSQALESSIGMFKIEVIEQMLSLLLFRRYGHVVAIFVAQIVVVVLYPFDSRILKSIVRGLAEDFLSHGAFRAIVVVSHEVAGGERILPQQLSYLGLDATERIDTPSMGNTSI